MVSTSGKKSNIIINIILKRNKILQDLSEIKNPSMVSGKVRILKTRKMHLKQGLKNSFCNHTSNTIKYIHLKIQ